MHQASRSPTLQNVAVDANAFTVTIPIDDRVNPRLLVTAGFASEGLLKSDVDVVSLVHVLQGP